MKKYIFLIFLFPGSFAAIGQQINPIPDYIFKYQMSVGRNAATDTAAYFSIGPKYGATKGFMPPMVADTASISSAKRNGLIIFSKQKNKLAWWDSAGAKWSDIAGGSTGGTVTSISTSSGITGGTITSSGTLKADTSLLSTKLYRQKGIDSVISILGSLGGGTVLSVAAGTGMNFSTITTTGTIAVDTLVMSTKAYRKKGDDSVLQVLSFKIGGSGTSGYIPKFNASTSVANSNIYDDATNIGIGTITPSRKLTLRQGTNATDNSLMSFNNSAERWVIGNDGGSGSNDFIVYNGNYRLVVRSGGNVGIGTDAPTQLLDVDGKARIRTIDSSTTAINMLYADVDGTVKKTALPAAGGSGTVTSVATSTGITGGTITTTGTLKADTALLSTRARVQKGIDSVVNLISSSGGGTVLSVSAGTGMSFTTITTSGSVNVDTATMSTRSRVQKVGDSLALLISNAGGGTVTSVTAGSGLTGGTITSSGTIKVDTASTATRARVQKGIDSVAALVAASGSGTVTSVDVSVGSAGSNISVSGSPITTSGTITLNIPTASASNRGALSSTDWSTFNDKVPASRTITINGTLYDLSANRSWTTPSGTVTSVAAGYGINGGTITSTGTHSVDTTSMSTRSRLQKSIDSIGQIAGTKGTGTVTSVSAGTGMSFTTITGSGSVNADTLTLATRPRVKKSIDSLAALIVQMSTNSLTAASGWTFAKDPVNGQEIKTLNKLYNNSSETVTINLCVYKTTATFSTGAWVKVATVPSGYTPRSVIHCTLPNYISGDQFESGGNVSFADDAWYENSYVLRIKTNGDVEVRIDTVSASATLSGSNYVIIPVVVNYNIETSVN